MYSWERSQNQLTSGYTPLPSQRAGLDVLVEERVGVEVRARNRAGRTGGDAGDGADPSGDRGRGVYGVLVHDKCRPSSSLTTPSLADACRCANRFSALINKLGR